MAPLTIYHDPEGQTLTVWFDDPTKGHVAEKTGDEIVLIKDKRGRVIGLERLHHTLPPGQGFEVQVIER